MAIEIRKAIADFFRKPDAKEEMEALTISFISNQTLSQRIPPGNVCILSHIIVLQPGRSRFEVRFFLLDKNLPLALVVTSLFHSPYQGFYQKDFL